MVYQEIFVEDVYRQHEMTFSAGDCILDIGANTGLFELFLDGECPSATVYACEPIPAVHQILSANIGRLKQIKATALNIGVSNQTGSSTFSYFPRLSCASTMYPDLSSEEARRGRAFVREQFRTHRSATLRYQLTSLPEFLQASLAERVRKYYGYNQPVNCHLRTVASLIDEYGIEKIDFLKIDAERSEREILEGLRPSDWDKVKQLVVEVHEGDVVRLEIEQMLRNQGFTVAVDNNPHFENIFMLYAKRN